MSSLLVVGGSGFFGKSVLDSFRLGKLNALGIKRVAALARNASRLALETPELISSSVELIDGDITSLQYLPEAELIIHAASSSNAQRYMEKPEQEVENIIEGAAHFCDLVSRTYPQPKVLYCSSGAVYGKQPAELPYIREDYAIKGNFGQDTSKKAYTYGKRQAEVIFRQTASKRNIEVCIARCFAFVGKWLPRDSHFAIGNFIIS